MAHTIYENFVLENKIEDMLTTAIDMNAFLTPDYSLAENAGMKKTVNTYVATGNVEDLAKGEGNNSANDITVSYTSKDYVVSTTQGHLPYYDEEEMTDPMVVEVGLKGMADKMTNDLTSKAIGAMNEATLQFGITDWGFNDFVDAIALYPYENENGLFCLINPKQKASIRKQLADDLKYSEGFARTGYIGSVCGVPIISSKAVPENFAFLGTKEAVKCFVKKGVEIEQSRDADHRKNDIYARKVMLVALVDATRMIKMGREQATKASITTKASGAKAIAGAATTGATVEVYINGVKDGEATAANSAYTFTAAKNLVAGDKIKVVAKVDGYFDSVAEALAV